LNHPTRPAIDRLLLGGALLAPAMPAATRPDRPPLTERAALVLPPTRRLLAGARVPEGVRYDSLQARHVLPDIPLMLTSLVHDGARPPLARRDHDPALPQRTPIPDPLSGREVCLAEYGRANELLGRLRSGILGRMAAVH